MDWSGAAGAQRGDSGDPMGWICRGVGWRETGEVVQLPADRPPDLRHHRRHKFGCLRSGQRAIIGPRKRQKAKNMPKLGTKKRPAVVRVATQERAEEIMAICNAQGWQVVVGLEPDEPENISDIERLRNPPVPLRVEPTTGRNDPCPCGSGNKFKKCCGA